MSWKYKIQNCFRNVKWYKGAQNKRNWKNAVNDFIQKWIENSCDENYIILFRVKKEVI